MEFWIRQWLFHSPAGPFDYIKLELPRAWEPATSSGPSPDGEGKETQNGFLNGNQSVE
jgi:hypothetical protein